MSIFNILSLIGGLVLFLFGMNYMGASLEKLAGGKFESIGTNKNAKRTAVVHLAFNTIGVILAMAIFYVANAKLTIDGELNKGTTISVEFIALN